ncbi:MAG TPA: L,D-transpeptidase family protein [Negativicutes bacterium]|nr:L,D-transpeptidase family protein [Negativicutes bacterium]
MKYCFYCGTNMQDTAAFCPKCGKPTVAQVPPPLPEASVSAPKSYLWLIIGLIALILMGVCAAFFFLKEKPVSPANPFPTEQTVAPTLAPTPTASTSAVIPAFAARLSSTVKQALIVQDNGSGAFTGQIVLWAQAEGRWQKLKSFPVVMGKNGFADPGAKEEGDNRTPTGIFNLGTAFGYAGAIDTKMPYRRLTENDFWVDDTASAQYNRWVTGVPQARSYERLLRSDSMHKYGVVIQYNTNPVIAGKGSAIFLHVWRSPDIGTAGGVAMAEDNLVQILRWLDSEKQPTILLNVKE